MRSQPVLDSILLVLFLAGFAAFDTVPAHALPLYATRQGLACRACHFDPNGGGPRNDLGFQYEKNRHELLPDVGKWADLAIGNKVGDALYFGTNLRHQYTYVRQVGSGQTGVSTFFPMQGALYVTFSPHQSLVATYNRDLRQSRDAWLMLKDLPVGLYVKAGQFRVPFGLRQDDHTSAVRAGFRESLAGSFGTSGLLPYDPRDVEGGLEVGVTPLASSSLSATAAITNGGQAFENKAQAMTGKVFVNESLFQAGVSAYDNWRSTTHARDTRYSAYAGVRVGERVVLLGEAGLGKSTDPTGADARPRGFFAEADYRVNRAVLVRGKYDFIDLDKDVAGMASERYTAETDVTLAPFVDVKLSLRRIVPEDAPDENQVLVQWHAYY